MFRCQTSVANTEAGEERGQRQQPRKRRSTCLPLKERCDGVRQCYHGDDEEVCDVSCPGECICVGYSVNCSGKDLVTLPGNITLQLRKLDASFNRLGLKSNMWMKYVRLQNNTDSEIFFTFLFHLNLSYNTFEALNMASFANLPNLQVLDISHNKIKCIENSAFNGLPGSFGLPLLRILNISNNAIESIQTGAFEGLAQLRMLNLSGNAILSAPQTIFQPLVSLTLLLTDDYRFCCFLDSSMSKEVLCYPEQDEFSSCADLIRSRPLRAFLWIIAICALLGNTTTLALRLKLKALSPLQSFIVTHLAMSDFLMGVYMLTIAGADTYYRGEYVDNSVYWKNSDLCRFAGFLAAVSSEVSAFMLVLITLDRFIGILFPFSHLKLDMHKARVGVCISWVVGGLLGGIPLLPLAYFNGEFYSRSGVCLSLHLTTETRPGWEYSVAVFIVLNFIVFLLIFVGYTWMYVRIRQVSAVHSSKRRATQQAQLGSRMLAIIITDFVCWFPVGVLGK